ncbi:SMI1/KNR4 family protein [Dasania marina]|uniref:SMI1/KNR4 family protein n=1 Tax=Dasania marina TaxID=471499 RepID=UPI0030DD99A1|tara:strand:- start:38 stop:451 length:414 start_codon:yes stop_codon:yes gene_type:complete
MNLESIIEELREHNLELPLPPRLPTEDEVCQIEKELGLNFHPDYKTYLLKASDVVFGALEPALITIPNSHTYLPEVVKSARAIGVPNNLLPFCQDNGDYFCLNDQGKVIYWSHNGATDESWPNLASWLKEEWISKHA